MNPFERDWNSLQGLQLKEDPLLTHSRARVPEDFPSAKKRVALLAEWHRLVDIRNAADEASAQAQKGLDEVRRELREVSESAREEFEDWLGGKEPT